MEDDDREREHVLLARANALLLSATLDALRRTQGVLQAIAVGALPFSAAATAALDLGVLLAVMDDAADVAAALRARSADSCDAITH